MYKISFERIFRDGQMLERDLPVTLTEVRTPFEVIRFLNGMFGSYDSPEETGGKHRGCLESAADMIPSDNEKLRISFLKGDRCRCRLIVEKTD